MKARQASEQRLLRPYIVDSQLERVFSETRVWVGEHQCIPGKSISIPPTSYLNESVRLVWAPDDSLLESFSATLIDGLQATGVNAEDAVLRIAARTGHLKIYEKIWSIRLTELRSLSDSIVLTNPDIGCLALQAPHHQREVIVGVNLAREVTPLGAGYPGPKGYWLARASFGIRSTSDALLFNINFFTDADRADLEVDQNTVTFLQLPSPEDLVCPLDEAMAPTLWLDEEVYAALCHQADKTVFDTWLKEVALNAFRDLLHAFARISDDVISASDNMDILGDSLIGTILRSVAGPRSSRETRELLLAQARERPELVAAKAEHRHQLKRTLLSQKG